MQNAKDVGFEIFFKLTTSILMTNMVCFDSNNKLNKYETPEDILEEFYHV